MDWFSNTILCKQTFSIEIVSVLRDFLVSDNNPNLTWNGAKRRRRRNRQSSINTHLVAISCTNTCEYTVYTYLFPCFIYYDCRILFVCF